MPATNVITLDNKER